MDLGGFARRQGGVFTRAQAIACGFTERQVDYRIASKRWRRIHRSVLADATVPDSSLSGLWAAVLAAGPEAVVSHSSAALLWGWEVQDRLIHLTVPPHRHPRIDQTIQIHRLPLAPGDSGLMRRLPVTSRLRTITDCVTILPRARLGALLDRAIQQGWVSESDLTRAISRHRARTGNKELRRLAAGLSPGAHSKAERLLHRLFRAHRITGWQPNFPVVEANRVLAVVDVAFVDVKLAVEVDGRAFHVSPERFQTDRTKQNALVALGWNVLRFTWADLTERPAYVVASVLAELARS